MTESKTDMIDVIEAAVATYRAVQVLDEKTRKLWLAALNDNEVVHAAHVAVIDDVIQTRLMVTQALTAACRLASRFEDEAAKLPKSGERVIKLRTEMNWDGDPRHLVTTPTGEIFMGRTLRQDGRYELLVTKVLGGKTVTASQTYDAPFDDLDMVGLAMPLLPEIENKERALAHPGAYSN